MENLAIVSFFKELEHVTPITVTGILGDEGVWKLSSRYPRGYFGNVIRNKLLMTQLIKSGEPKTWNIQRTIFTIMSYGQLHTCNISQLQIGIRDFILLSFLWSLVEQKIFKGRTESEQVCLEFMPIFHYTK